MKENPGGFGRRLARTLTHLVVGLGVLALGGAVLFLLSQLNARTFTLEVQEDRLIIMKGRLLPAGALPFHPADPGLADAYAPLPLDGQPPGSLLERRFTERDELDRALFDLLERLARPRVMSDDPQALERGLYYVRRAEKLGGLSEEQRRTLGNLQAEVSFFLARSRLDDARRQLVEALAQLRLAADSRGRHARSANQMLSEVEPSVKALEESLRRAVHSLSAPPPPSTAPPSPR